MLTRICEQCGGEFKPEPVKVKTLIACPNRKGGCGRKWFTGGRWHWYPKTYWQLPEDI